jgi:hypothetical protein
LDVFVKVWAITFPEPLLKPESEDGAVAVQVNVVFGTFELKAILVVVPEQIAGEP